MTTDITTLRTLIADASTWTGLTWDSGPTEVLAALERAIRLAGDRDDDSPEVAYRLRKTLAGAAEPSNGYDWSDDGSYRSQQLRRDWRDLLAEIEALSDESSIEDIETARQHAEWLADANRESVEETAAQAAEHGALALEAAEAGEWDDAIAALEEAVGCERQYGDAPAWGPALAEAKRLADLATEAE